MYRGSTYKSVPAYSIPGKPKGQSINSNPGPGAYDHGSSLGNVRSSIPKSGKYDIKNTNPGPGNYDIKGGFGYKGKSQWSNSERWGKTKDTFPGPGAYDGIGKENTSKYSFGKQERDFTARKAGEYYDIPHSIPDVAKYAYPSNEKRKIRF